MNTRVFSLIVFGVLALASCKKETIKPEDKTGKIVFHFLHQVKGQLLHTDSLGYVNRAGNQYEVDELKYFISDVYLHNAAGSRIHIDAQTAIHYVDIDIAATTTWQVFDSIPQGNYDSVSFIFGLTRDRNISFAFVNPPEVNMFWPTVLGGGYHYMMMNGKWKDLQGKIRPFDFHLGIGQVYSGVTTSVDSITGFIQNYFKINLPLPSMQISANTTHTIHLAMDIENWFETPHTWDFNYWGNYIMQNQAAMKTACENGYDVFSIESISSK
jgi:hypothetical protein